MKLLGRGAKVSSTDMSALSCILRRPPSPFQPLPLLLIVPPLNKGAPKAVPGILPACAAVTLSCWRNVCASAVLQGSLCCPCTSTRSEDWLASSVCLSTFCPHVIFHVLHTIHRMDT